ncbi:hypothetical protein F5B22DRAFT_638502 [Xylaria bambusicola]|uniref:uncharacterized protein n=1 Tax=Xylaria bambusicola TaxID=326684 RepID=UPI002007DA76|nr:uncharacterized protein F5B22DRAFT_638502 [Xylaria bambusicola]KAI0508793.1 hypothetical protein F5B22DRAFT_638502 [Xylaria bambusicola]
MSDVKLSPRYEIRPLELEHLEWAKAIFAHSFVFSSPLWRNLYPHNKTARFYGLYQASHFLIKHQIRSGLSLGIFDREYVFKNPSSASLGGALHFDHNDTSVDEDELLRQMDTPLVSIACAFDAFYALDNRFVAPVTGRLPASASFYEALGRNDDDGDDPWPTAPGQVLQRMGTATRADAVGEGFMKAMAHDMMRRAAEMGFSRIQIECFHDAVTAVWANPPLPFKGEVAREVDTYALNEIDAQGRRRFPFRPVRQRLTRVSVTLR